MSPLTPSKPAVVLVSSAVTRPSTAVTFPSTRVTPSRTSPMSAFVFSMDLSSREFNVSAEVETSLRTNFLDATHALERLVATRISRTIESLRIRNFLLGTRRYHRRHQRRGGESCRLK